MKDILAKHPDLKLLLTFRKEINTYKITTEDGDIIEQWTRDDNGHWRDTTAIAQAQQELIRAQQELIRARQIRNSIEDESDDTIE